MVLCIYFSTTHKHTLTSLFCKLLVSFVFVFQFGILLRFHTPIKCSFGIFWCKWVELFKVKPSSSSLAVFSFIWPIFASLFSSLSFIASARYCCWCCCFCSCHSVFSGQMNSISNEKFLVLSTLLKHFHFTTTISHPLTFSQPISFRVFLFGTFNLWRWLLVVGGVYLCSPVTIKHTYIYSQKMTHISECKTKPAVVFRVVYTLCVHVTRIRAKLPFSFICNFNGCSRL